MYKEELKELAEQYFTSKGYIPEDSADIKFLELLTDAFIAGYNTCLEHHKS